ncbi:MAG TPA: CoA transferase [Acidimicrobiales bacterium]|nr:CoA transferase [Acidimicrobiales bacterium]
MTSGAAGPLVGLKIVELGHLVAGPLAGSLMADLGAEVVHVEPPGAGDPARRVGPQKDGIGLWWKVGARNKRSVTIDLDHEEGRDVARRLVAWADVVVTNFRPTTLERWHLDFESLRAVNSTVVVLQVSAFGATGPRRALPGFGKIGEAWSGAPHLSGSPGDAPAFAGFLLADAMAALMGVVAVEAALYRRAADPTFDGEWVDIALFEPLFRMVDWQVPAYDQLGVAPTRTGNDASIAETALLDTFSTADGEWIVVSCGNHAAVERAAALVGEPSYDDRARTKAAMRAWVAARPTDACLADLDAAGVPASRIFDAADIVGDPVYAARGDITTVEDPDLGPLRMPSVLPHLRHTPGRVWRAAPALGEDNDLVLRDYLGLDVAEIARLQERGAIGGSRPA